MSRRSPYRWLLLLPLLAMLGTMLGVGYLLRQSGSTPQTTEDPDLARADYYLVTADIRSFGPDGALLQRLQAERVAYFPDDSAQLEQVQLTRLPGPWQLRAERGFAPSGLQQMRLSGAVQLDTLLEDGSPAQLRTEILDVDWQQRTLTSQTPVQLESATVLASAQRLRASLAHRDVELLGEVRVAHQP